MAYRVAPRDISFAAMLPVRVTILPALHMYLKRHGKSLLQRMEPSAVEVIVILLYRCLSLIHPYM
jgi:hypothetical protein